MNNHSPPLDPSELAKAVQVAGARQRGESWDDLDIEAIASFVQGNSSSIPEHERMQLLARIAQDPDLGKLVRDLHGDIGHQASVTRWNQPRTFFRLAWAASLLGAATVGVVHLTTPSGPSPVKVMDSQSSPPEFLEQLGVPSVGPSSTLLSDPLFIGLFVLAVVLGFASFWPRKSADQ